jgi:hypothetical protein
MIKIEDLQQEAKEKFLRTEGVTGVGILNAPEPTLVFLLLENAPAIRKEIETWAAARSVRAEFRITGRIRTGTQNRR